MDSSVEDYFSDARQVYAVQQVLIRRLAFLKCSH